MPCISQFYGISVYINYRDHNPPHFHAYYGGSEVLISIQTGEVLAGEMPNRGLKFLKEWLELHRSELYNAWELARQHKPLPQIEPLD